MSRSYDEPDWAKLIGVFSQATTKMQKGSAKYGQYDPATCTRDLYEEAQDEILDAINYLGMMFLKLAEWQKTILKSREKVLK